MLAVAAFAGALSLTPALAEVAVKVPAPAVDNHGGEGLQKVVLAGGCFWGIQAVYQHTDGVTKAVSGYSGGTKDTASYDVVSSGRTGHAEAVEVTYDPKKVSYGKILQIFFSVAHDPTQLDRQGPDTGPQYRSEIFYSTPEQKKITEAYVAQLGGAKVYKRPIVTKLSSLSAFYPAEDYHQDYAYLHPMQPYIYINDRPKVENLKRLFSDVYRDKPALVRAATN
ncbi:MAG: peptide-methionine (S)-S-oxide reductase [Rhizobiales bacterium 64-17]|nr:MAG: peptide-methionine (S)-S-oxide reductase [Rhizobiales bacterium 64-17]